MISLCHYFLIQEHTHAPQRLRLFFGGSFFLWPFFGGFFCGFFWWLPLWWLFRGLPPVLVDIKKKPCSKLSSITVGCNKLKQSLSSQDENTGQESLLSKDDNTVQEGLSSHDENTGQESLFSQNENTEREANNIRTFFELCMLENYSANIVRKQISEILKDEMFLRNSGHGGNMSAIQVKYAAFISFVERRIKQWGNTSKSHSCQERICRSRKPKEQKKTSGEPANRRKLQEQAINSSCQP